MVVLAEPTAAPAIPIAAPVVLNSGLVNPVADPVVLNRALTNLIASPLILIGGCAARVTSFLLRELRLVRQNQMTASVTIGRSQRLVASPSLDQERAAHEQGKRSRRRDSEQERSIAAGAISDAGQQMSMSATSGR